MFQLQIYRFNIYAVKLFSKFWQILSLSRGICRKMNIIDELRINQWIGSAALNVPANNVLIELTMDREDVKLHWPLVMCSLWPYF